MIQTIINFILNLFGLSTNDHTNENDANTEIYTQYAKRKIMTSTEIKFYNLIKEILSDKYILWPQINLASIIDKKNKYKRQFQNELFRNIDFGIFDKDTLEVLLLIELNDNTHNNINRRKRNEKVKSLCNECGYNIIAFWLNKPTEYNYVKNRILYYLGDLDLKVDKTQELHNISNIDDK